MLKRCLVLVLSLFLLTACSNKSHPDIVTFTSWGSITEVTVLKQIISEFEKENPNIKVQFIHTPQNYFQKLHLLFASNTAPDVIFINNLNLPMYASNLQDLSEFVDKTEFFPQAIEGLSINNKLLAVPRDVSNLVLYINTEKFTGDNIQTLSDLIKVTEKITTKDCWGISFEEDIYWALPYLAYFDEEIGTNFNPTTSKGLLFYKNLRDKYKVVPTKSQIGSSTPAQMFLDKKIAIYLSGRWMYPKISEKAEFNWKIIAFPQGKGTLPCDCSGWGISKSSKNKEAAIKLINYLSNEKSAEYFAKTGLIVPARIKAAQLLNNEEHNERVFLEVIKTSKNTPIPKNYKKLTDEINSKVFN